MTSVAHREGPRFRVGLPGFLLHQEIPLGDLIKRITSALGIPPCPGCERRAATLNRWLAFTPRPGPEPRSFRGAPHPVGTVCLRSETISQAVCDSMATVEEVICDGTTTVYKEACVAWDTVKETVCDATDSVSETVCDATRDLGLLGGLICTASHVVTRTVCTASHVVSKTVCTSSRLIATTVCAASHTVTRTVCTASHIAAYVVCVLEARLIEVLGWGLDRPEIHFIVQTERPEPLDGVAALVRRHLGVGWQVEKVFPYFDPRRDLPEMESFYRIRKPGRLDENPFDVAYLLWDSAGFVRVDPDLPYTRFMGEAR